MKLGITGLVGAGKSTIFGALTESPIDAARQAEDRIGTIRVPDERIDTLTGMYKPRKTIYAQVEYFLPAILGGGPRDRSDQTPWTALRGSDALIHVIRNFKGYGVEAPDPQNDFTTLDQELILADLVVAEKRLERLAGEKQRGRNFSPEEYGLLEQCREALESETPLRHIPDLAAAPLLKGYAFLSAKPMLVLFNNEDDDDDMPDFRSIIDREECMVIRGKLEQELCQMSDEDAADFLSEFNITASAMDRVIKRSYELLGLISFFTVGDDEVRAWTIRADTAADDAAGTIHTDMKKGFIRAEVVSYNDLMDAGSYPEARNRGTVRLEGKTYTVLDGDILNIRFNV